MKSRFMLRLLAFQLESIQYIFARNVCISCRCLRSIYANMHGILIAHQHARTEFNTYLLFTIALLSLISLFDLCEQFLCAQYYSHSLTLGLIIKYAMLYIHILIRVAENGQEREYAGWKQSLQIVSEKFHWLIA